MGNLKFVFWDVKHGHATYIHTPNDRHIVVDLGIGSYENSNGDFSPLLHLKNRYNISQLDYVIVTHPHLDHIDDILNLDSLYPIVFCRPRHLSREEIVENVKNSDLPKFEKYLSYNSNYNDSLDGTINDPDISSNWGGVEMKTFLTTQSSTSNINNHSIVKVFKYANLKVVIPGDNEPPSFNELMNNSEFKNSIKDCDVLLAPHHGRESGFHNDFVTLANPRITIVSDGSFCDSSASTRYSVKSRGWTVHRRNGTDETRKCLTTNTDGVITVEIGWSSNTKNFLSITVN
jgi:competence protein ComEC